MGSERDGGPAFPGPNDGNVSGAPGMTLLDYFAGQALMATEHHLSFPVRASVAYAVADAMLAEREKRMRIAEIAAEVPRG